MAEIATRLLGQTISPMQIWMNRRKSRPQQCKTMHARSVPLTEVKNCVSTLIQFVGDNIGIF